MMTGFVLQILFINGVGATRDSVFNRQQSVDVSALTTEEKQRGVGQQQATGHRPSGMPVFVTGTSVDESSQNSREATTARHQNSESGSGSPPRLQYPTGESRNEKLLKRFLSQAEREQLEQDKRQKSDNSATWWSSNQPGASSVVGASSYGNSGANGSGFMSSNSNYGYGANYGQGTGSIYKHNV